MLPEIDYKGLGEEELQEVYANSGAELERRYLIATEVERLARIQQESQEARGGDAHTDGEPWTQPLGAHDAYALGTTATHDGKTWVSLTPYNTWAPGVSGWREVVEDGDAPAEWVRPSGTHDAYQPGDRVTFEGKVYRSVHPGANTWSPTEYPPAWELEDDED